MAESNMSQELQTEVLNAIRKSQAAVIEAIETWASTVSAFRPKLPEMNIPYADKLPKAEDLVAGAYDFAEQLLASQRTFAEDVLKASAPLMWAGGNGESARKPAAAAAK